MSKVVAGQNSKLQAASSINRWVHSHADKINWIGHKVIVIGRYAAPLVLFVISKKIYNLSTVILIVLSAISFSALALMDILRQRKIEKFAALEPYLQELFWNSAAILSEMQLGKLIFKGLNLSYAGYESLKLGFSFGLGMLSNYTIFRLKELSTEILKMRDQLKPNLRP